MAPIPKSGDVEDKEDAAAIPTRPFPNQLAFPRAAGYNHHDFNCTGFGGGKTVPTVTPTRQEREFVPAPERMPIAELLRNGGAVGVAVKFFYLTT